MSFNPDRAKPVTEVICGALRDLVPFVQWMKQLCLFYKFLLNRLPKFDLILHIRHPLETLI